MQAKIAHTMFLDHKKYMPTVISVFCNCGKEETVYLPTGRKRLYRLGVSCSSPCDRKEIFLIEPIKQRHCRGIEIKTL